MHDRWAQREGGRNSAHIVVPGQANAPVKRERDQDIRQEARARAMEQRIKQQRGEAERKVKVERFDDDSRREGRGLERVGHGEVSLMIGIRRWSGRRARL